MKNLVSYFIVLSFVIMMSSSNSISAMNQRHIQEGIPAPKARINRPVRIDYLPIVSIMYGGTMITLICIARIIEELNKVKSKFCKFTSLCEC